MEEMTARDWRTAAKAVAVLAVLALVAGLALGASWQRAAQRHDTKTGTSYVNVDGRDYFPDEQTRGDANPTRYVGPADWTLAPCTLWQDAKPIPAYTVTTVCVTPDGEIAPVNTK